MSYSIDFKNVMELLIQPAGHPAGIARAWVEACQPVCMSADFHTDTCGAGR